MTEDTRQGDRERGVQGPITQTVVENLSALRRARHWTGFEVAERMTKLGTPWNHQIVSKLERGSRVAVTVDELVTLAALFEVTPEKLLGEVAVTTTDERLSRLEAAVFGDGE